MASNMDSGEERRAELKMFICDVCGREYMRKSSFTRHIRSHEETVKPGDKMNRCAKSKKRKLSAAEYYCEECRDFVLWADLDRHICAPSAALGPFNCPVCGEYFFHESILRRHKRLHDKFPELFYENELRKGGADRLILEQSPDTVRSTADLDNNCASLSTSISSPPHDLAEVTPSEPNKNISELDVSSRNVHAGPSGVSDSLETPRSGNISRKRQPPKANYVAKETKQCISCPEDPETTLHFGSSNEGSMALTRRSAEPPAQQSLIQSEANVSETCCYDGEETPIHKDVFMDSLGLHSEGRAVGSTHRVEALEHDGVSTGVTNQLVFPESSERACQSTSAAAGGEIPISVASTSLETETHIPTNPPGEPCTADRSVKTMILGTTTTDLESGLAPVYQMKLFGTFSGRGTNGPIQGWVIDESRRPFAVPNRPSMVAGSAGTGEGCTASSKSVPPQQTVDNTHSEIPRGDTQIAHLSDVSEGGNGPIPATTVCGHHPEPVRHEAACVSQRNWGNVPLTSNMGMGHVPFYGIGHGHQQCNSMAQTVPVNQSIIPPMFNRPMLFNNQMYPGLYYQNAGRQARVPEVAVHPGMMPNMQSQELPSRFFYPR